MLVPAHLTINSFPEHFEIKHMDGISRYRFMVGNELYGTAIDHSEIEVESDTITDMLLQNISETYDIVLSGKNELVEMERELAGAH